MAFSDNQLAPAPSEKKLRIAILTVGDWTFDRDQIVRGLLADKGLEIVLIVVDEFRRPLWKRAHFLLRVWGLLKFISSLLLSVVERLIGALGRGPIIRWHNLFVSEILSAPSLEALAIQHKINIAHVKNINAPISINCVVDASSDLGIILGGRILKSELLQASRLGTLNIHKHDVHRYRGGAAIGYPELCNEDKTLGITVHWATAAPDAGPVVATCNVPIQKFDTVESLSLKAACASIDLYIGAVRQLAFRGSFSTTPNVPLGPILYSTPLIDRLVQEKQINRQRRHFAQAEKVLGLSPTPIRVLRKLRAAMTFAALPYLMKRRAELILSHHAPIVIFYYHGVSNAAENWMTLDLPRFHRQIEYLLRYFHILSLDEAVLALRSGHCDYPAVVLTFDDGYASALNELAPYLKARGLPATFFVCAAAADGGHALKHDQERGFGRPPLMDSKGWNSLISQGFEIGCHGFDHEDMATLNDYQLRRAMIDSADLISSRVGRAVRYFSFPFGNKRNISLDAIHMAAERFDAVFSAYGGYNIPGRSGPFHFTRFSNPVDMGSLVAIMNGFHRIRPYYCDPV